MRDGEGGYLLHWSVLQISSYESHLLLEMGANIHLIRSGLEKSPEDETPASLVLYCANTLQSTLRDATVALMTS